MLSRVGFSLQPLHAWLASRNLTDLHDLATCLWQATCYFVLLSLLISQGSNAKDYGEFDWDE